MVNIKVTGDINTEIKKDYLAFWAYLAPAVTMAVKESFYPNAHPMKNVTEHEIRRRTDLVHNLVKTLRKEYKWSKFRIAEYIGPLLNRLLDGESQFDLEEIGPNRSSWIVDT